jgi:FdrA protein
MKKIVLKKNRYVDSVSLMSIGDRVKQLDGVHEAEVYMGTPANMEILTELGFELPDNISSNDLVIAVNCETKDQVEKSLKLIDDILNHRVDGCENTTIYRSLDEIDLEKDSYDLVQISLPGEYAVEEARRAINKGLDVFIFSDNVSLEDELELKQLGLEKDCLVMGPDCGVGLIGGVALAAGSIVRHGPIGIVGASGSGAQEVACIIEKCGYGVSSIIGTGGRDLYPEIGGISMIEGMKRLDNDPETSVIVLVSKLADLSVMEKVLTGADKLSKPVVAVFLGSDETLFKGHRTHGAFSLEQAATEAVRLISGKAPEFGYSHNEINEIVKKEMSRFSPEQKYFRGIYCGGTFTEEGLIYFSRHNKEASLYSNLGNSYSIKLDSHLISKGNTILDLGSEEFTKDEPHPVFEPSLRLKRFYKELEDPKVAVILLDFITGPGVHEDPITPFINAYQEKVVEKGRTVTVIASICGSMEDPQNVIEKAALLKKVGVIVTDSNYQSTRLASALMKELAKREEI